MSVSDPKRWKTLAALGIAYLMVVLDTSVVNVVLPSIQGKLHFSPENLQRVISGYGLTFGGFLLLGGRAGDLLGRRRLFVSATPRSASSAGSPARAPRSACCSAASSPSTSAGSGSSS